MKGGVSSSDDECGDSSVSTPLFSTDKLCELKNSGYMKKKIISAIKKSLKTNNNRIQHALTLNDVSVSEEKEIGNGCRQSLNIRIDLNDKLFYSSPDTTAAAVNVDAFKLNDSTSVGKCSHCLEKRDLVKDEDAWRAYFVCVKCGKREERRWAHDDCKDKCCKSTSIYCDNCLTYKLTSNDHNFDVLRNAKFNKYMYVVTCPNGGGMSLHMDYEKIINLTPDEQRCVAREFLKESFKEDKKGFAQFTISIVHNGSTFMPDLLKLLAELHPTLPVKTTKLKSNIETEVMDLGTYYTKVKETYNNGTYAFGPLNETQAASVKNDECGAYLPELLSLLEKSPFLSQVLPWSVEMTTKRFKSPHESDDGPIFWCRPGEQIVSLDRNSKRNRWNADEIETFLKERQQNLKSFCEKRYIVEELKKYRRSYSSREFLFEDRTRPHADQVWGNHFEPTAAVGLIQAIHPDEIPEHNRACKEIVVFHARHFEMLEALLHIDVTAAPKQQCAEWLDDAKLNMIRQMNIRYSKLHLYDNDIYFIPRKIVHQFKTISATLSVAWHTRLLEYYLEPDPPIKEAPIEETEEPAPGTEESGGSRSSSPSPIRKKATPKKRKLSCSDNEVTPVTPKKRKKPVSVCKSRSPSPATTPAKKKAKPRSRSGTPLKRIRKARAAKTPKKNTPAALKEESNEILSDGRRSRSRSLSAEKSRKRCRSGSPVPVAEGTESGDKSRSSSPMVVEERSTSGNVCADESKKKSRPNSPTPMEQGTTSRSVSRDESKKKSRSNSPTPVESKKKSETSSPEMRKVGNDRRDEPKKSSVPGTDGEAVAGNGCRDKSKKKKSRSGSKSPKRRDDRVSDGGDVDGKKKKKTKHRSRSRSKTRKTDENSNPHVEKCASVKKKKRDRSRSPKKHDKPKETKNGRGEEKKSHNGETGHHSSKHKKHDRKESIRSRSASPAKKQEKCKKSHHVSRSPSKRADDKSTETAKETSGDDQLVPKSPSHSFGSLSTEKPESPVGNADETLPLCAGEDDLPHTPVTESMAGVDENLERVAEERRSETPPMAVEPMESLGPALLETVKEEPRSPVHEPVSIKKEPESPRANTPIETVSESVPSIKAEPQSSPKNVDIAKPPEPKKPAKTISVAKDAPTNKDHRKEKLWDVPLFSFEDCDKFVLTTRPNSNKNGDKIVKSKTLNSLNKTDGKNQRAPSKSPPRIQKERKPDPSKKIKLSDEKKNHSPVDRCKATAERNDKEKSRPKDTKPSSEHQQRAKEAPRKESHSSDKLATKEQNDDRKSSHSSNHTKDKSAEHRDRTKEKSSHSRESGNGERRKRSQSPTDKHRVKHSKKHKKHRSSSRSRVDGENAANAVTVNTVASTCTTSSVDDKEKNDVVVTGESQSSENYAGGYRLMYPRVEIVDIGARLKTKRDVEDSDTSVTVQPVCNEDAPIVIEDSATSEINSEDE